MTLRTARQDKGFSLKQLADAAGCSQPYLSMLERGARKRRAISYRLATAIARELGQDPEQLFGQSVGKRVEAAR